MKKSLTIISSIIIFCYVTSSSLLAQDDVLSHTDSVSFKSIRNDTTQLKPLTKTLGTKLSLMAQYQLGFLTFKAKSYTSSYNYFKVLNDNWLSKIEGVESQYFLGRIFLIRENYSEAAKYLDQYIKSNKKISFRDNAEYYQLEVLVGQKSPQLHSVIDKFISTNKNASMVLKAKILKFEDYFNNRDLENVLLMAPGLTKEYPEAVYFVSRLYITKENYTEGMNYLEQYLKIAKDGVHRDNAEYYKLECLEGLKSPQLKGAINKFINGREKSVLVLKAKVIQFHNYLDGNDFTNAYSLANTVFKEYPSPDEHFLQIENKLLYVYSALKKYDEAIAHYQNGVKMYDPKSRLGALSQYLVAEAFIKKGEYEKARTEYQKVKLNYSSHADIVAWSDFGTAYSNYYQATKPVGDLTKNPTFKTDQARVDLALSQFEECIKKYPVEENFFYSQMLVAEIYKKKKDWNKALNAYEQFLTRDNTPKKIVPKERIMRQEKLEENLQRARLGKASILFDNLKREKEAEIVFNEAVTKNKGKENELYLNGMIYFRMKKYDKAKELLTACVNSKAKDNENAAGLLEFIHQRKSKAGGK